MIHLSSSNEMALLLVNPGQELCVRYLVILNSNLNRVSDEFNSKDQAHA
jgi:hypothetical protein